MNAFERATKVPCPVCLALAKKGDLARESVMPIPTFPPRNVDNLEICFDCQSAENLAKLMFDIGFSALRLVIANERGEALRMPEGMAELMGLCSKGIVKSAHLGQLDDHFSWLDEVYPIEEQ